MNQIAEVHNNQYNDTTVALCLKTVSFVFEISSEIPDTYRLSIWDDIITIFLNIVGVEKLKISNEIEYKKLKNITRVDTNQYSNTTIILYSKIESFVSEISKEINSQLSIWDDVEDVFINTIEIEYQKFKVRNEAEYKKLESC